VEKVPEDFFHGSKHSAGLRSRKRSSRENRRFLCLEKVPEDFFHGLLAWMVVP